MRITLPNNFFYYLLFIVCIVVPYLNNYELTFVVWSSATLVSLSNRYSLSILKQVACFVAILTIAFVMMFFNDYEAYYIIRDITYLLKPIFGLLLGYQLCKKNAKNFFSLLLNTGLIIAILHIIILITAVIVFKASSVNEIREYGGYFSDFEIYALIIAIFYKKFDIDFSKRKISLYITIIGFSAFMYLARTNFLQFIILFLAMKGYFRITKRSVIVVSSMIAFMIVGYSAVLYSNPKRNGKGFEAMLYKIKIAPIEPFKTKINRDDWRDFNDNYRSYENIMTVRQMARDGYAGMIFGKGIGSKVDLKQKVYLGSMELRYISFLHNGFMTVFLKAGLIGIFIYLFSISLFFKKVKSDNKMVQSLNLLFLGSGIFLIISSWVFMGLYNLLDSKSMLLGAFIYYREMIISKS